MPDENATNQPVWDAIDLGRDAIVEASAGTGKTHTLEKLVLRLVADERVPIEKILLVTFTEKAAGELRDRIRGALEKELAQTLVGAADPPRQRQLEEGLRGFDNATISTIHSFCQRVLREYAFENGLPMASEVASPDALAAIARAAVVDTLRSPEFRDTWGAKFGELLKDAGGPSADDLATRVAKSVAAFRSDKWDAPFEALLPDMIESEDAEIRHALSAVPASVTDGASMLSWAGGGHEIADGDSKTKEFLRALGDRIEALRIGDKDAIAQIARMPQPNANIGNPRLKGVRIEGVKTPRVSHVNPAAATLGARVAEGAAKRGGLAADEASAAFLRDLFDRAVQTFRKRVDEAGLLSYEDMIHRTADVVSRPESAPLRAKLREAYHVALVDEFQDTDGLQWEIFRTLFRHAAAMPPDGSGGPRMLLVVGDPKQAIYGFRGADVGTYLDARRVLADPASGQQHSLDKSFRSPKPLLDAFNDLFSEPDWFDAPPEDGNDGDRIVYRDVEAPPPGEQKRYQDADPDGTGRGPVTLLESLPRALRSAPGVDDGRKGLGNQDQCLPVFVRNAATEIRRLLDLGKGALVFRDKDGKIARTHFRAGDFCFLVKAKRHAAPIQRALDALGIRHTFYKEPGLFASAEAESVLALLDFAATPHRRGLRAAALLTPFFGIRLDELDSALSSDPPEVAKLVRKWTKLADERRWSRLFDSFVFETALRRPRGPDDRGFDRRFAGVRQIFDDLLAARGSSALVLEDFADTLRAWRDGDADAGEDASLRERETDEDRVQIMTMHASKGLEFPVVFVPYGFSEIVSRTHFKPDSVLLSGSDGRRRRVFRIDGKPLGGELLEAARTEQGRDVRRLLYVSLTRARVKFYLPWSARASVFGIGSAGSALRGGFLCKAILRHFGDIQTADAAVANPAEGTPNLGSSDPAAVAALAPSPSAAESAASPKPAALAADVPWELFDRRLRWDSFSSLQQGGAVSAADLKPEPEGEDRVDEAQDEGAGTSGGTGPDADSAVPRGRTAGNAFHSIMQALCEGADKPESPGFATVGDAEDFDALWDSDDAAALHELVAAAMRANGLANRGDGSTARALGRMAWAALRAPLPFADGPRRLADVARADRRAEVSFVAAERLAAGTEERDGSLNGSVDLLFRAGPGKPFFLLDWKTNELDAYDAETAKAEMDACGYRLQYRLYALAVADWLGGENRLGGAVYLFVRGGERGTGPAVFHESFAPGWRERFQGDAAAALRAVGRVRPAD